MTLAANVPATRRDDVVDIHHGIDVPDPYRWLEDGESAEVADWVAAQNSLTAATLGTPQRARWHERLVDLMELPVLQQAQLRGDTLFCYERPAGAEQFVLTRRSASDPTMAPTVLLDPATASNDAATALDWFYASDDGSLVAAGTSEGGTERSVLRLISAADGSTIGGEGDSIPDTRAASVAWEPDGSGFFYTRYPEGDEYHRTVHHHRIGADWHDDPVIWRSDDPQAWPWVNLSRDGRWLLVSVQLGYRRVDVHLLDRGTGTWTAVIDGVDALSWFDFAAAGDALVGPTNLAAPRYRVVRIGLDDASLAAGPDGWETIVAERDAVITELGVTGDGLLMVTSSGAVDTIHRLDADGAPREQPVVTGIGDPITVFDDGVVTSATASDEFVVVDSFESPTSLWKLDGAAASRWTAAEEAGALTGGLSVRRDSYRSADGTEIGLFLVHRADVMPGPDTPAIHYGYGGFTVNVGPTWSAQIGAWCAAGGLYAVAVLRGGNEYGEDWHRAGSRGNKQNVFDDFIAGTDHLVAEGLTSRDRLAIHGRSNGGLLVGAAMTQRPDLCAAVLCGVPLLDMVRFPRFLIAKLWTSEYGDPEVAEEFEWLWGYSPYHRVIDDTCYPATMIYTAEGDSRVDPLHARKMVARLQAAIGCLDSRPVLLSQEGRAGHGVGKPVSKRADEYADGLTFLGIHVGLQP